MSVKDIDMGIELANTIITINLLTIACRASMPTILPLRKECNKLRRLTQRSNDQQAACKILAEYRIAKSELRSGIKRGKVHSWQDLVDEVNGDPCGFGFKMKARKMTNKWTVLYEHYSRRGR